MSILEVVDYLRAPKLLRRVARPVRQEEIYTDPFAIFVCDLVDTMRAHRGLGLAATQVEPTAPDGVPWAVFVMRNGQIGRPQVVINPEIKSSGDDQWAEDGCLSFRSVAWKCRYPETLEAIALDDDWKPLDLVVTGREARCFVHETDHLAGRCMVDKMPRADKHKFLARVAKVRLVPITEKP
jgi:peptide deformylase